MNTHFTNFSSWTSGRVLRSMGTNHGSDDLPFQNWRSFKEAFAPELIELAARETTAALGRPVNRLVDPFGGSGTSSLAAQFLGIHPTTVEVNPYLADLIEAKVARYDFDLLSKSFAELMSRIDEGAAYTAPTTWPPTFVEPGKNGRFLFSRAVADRVQTYLSVISSLEYPEARRLFRVLLAGVLLPVSNVVVSGKGRRYRRGFQNRGATAAAVDDLFQQKVLSALFDLKRFEHRQEQGYRLLRGDAREALSACEMVDMAVFSPPYPNSFDYTDVYNVELWVLGYLSSAEDNRRLRSATLRSHVQIKRDFSATENPSATLLSVSDRLREKKDMLWSKDIPSMISAYFGDMGVVLSRLSDIILPEGRVYMVVGDSRYAGVDVPVAQILCEMSSAYNFSVVASKPFRSMRASPQQGGRPELAETLVVFSRR